MFFAPSQEQSTIINCVSNGNNAIVDAVAGSGKTTTITQIALHNPLKRILQLTYNTNMRRDVNNKLEALNITNMEVHTYHSLAWNYYDKEVNNDIALEKVINTDMSPRKSLVIPDILIIDEAQDMTELLLSMIIKYLRDIETKPTIAIFGDKWQAIYEYKGADSRFLTMGNVLWKEYGEFVSLSLHQSFRVTKNIAWFVNKFMIGDKRIVSKKTDKNRKIEYLRMNKYSINNHLYKYIEYLIKKKGYSVNDIFVLVKSVKYGGYKELENKLCDNGYSCFAPINDDKNIDNDIIKDKIIFTTILQSKGLERKVVIMYDFDQSCIKDKKIILSEKCPPLLYVGVTRACERLILYEDIDKPCLPFLKKYNKLVKNTYPNKIEFIGESPKRKSRNINSRDIPSGMITPTAIVSHISFSILSKINLILEELFEVLEDKQYSLNLPSTVDCEDVTDINALVIPCMYEQKLTKSNSMYEYIMNHKHPSYYKKYIAKIKYPCKTNDDYLYLTNVYIAIDKGLLHKVTQIENYGWFTKMAKKKSMAYLKEQIGKECEFEFELGKQRVSDNNPTKCFKYQHEKYGELKYTGRVDAIDSKTIWEFKCVTNLRDEHKLQLVVYAWIWNNCMKETKGRRKFKLMNIQTGEIFKLNNKKKKINKIMDLLLENKYFEHEDYTDEEFIERALQRSKSIYE